MFAIQLEGKLIMIEIIPEPIDPIVTRKTIFPKHNLMVRHKRHVHIDMTTLAGQLIKLCDIIPMAIHAQERLILNC